MHKKTNTSFSKYNAIGLLLMALMGEWASRWTCSCEQKENLKNMPCHVMDFLIKKLSYGNCLMTWWNIPWCGEISWLGKIVCDIVKYYVMSHNIFRQVMEYLATHIMVCYEINNGLLTLNMGLTKKVIENNIVWAFEKKKTIGCILSSFVQPMLQMSNH